MYSHFPLLYQSKMGQKKRSNNGYVSLELKFSPQEGGLGYADPYKAVKQHTKKDGWAFRPVIDNLNREHQIES